MTEKQYKKNEKRVVRKVAKSFIKVYKLMLEKEKKEKKTNVK